MGRAFAGRNYRLFLAGQGVSLVGTWMGRLASGWLVYRLAGPDAPWLLGVVSFASLAPPSSSVRCRVCSWTAGTGTGCWSSPRCCRLSSRPPSRGSRLPPGRALLLLLALVSFAPMPQGVLLPVFAAAVLGGGPHTLGLLSAASGAGAFAGALYLASRASVLGLGRVIVAASVALGLGLAGFSRSGSVWLSAGLLVLTGCGMMVQMAAANTLIQTLVDEDKRGRVMGFCGMAFQGAAPFGSLLGGWLAGHVGHVGPAAVVLGSGVVVLLGGLTFATQLSRLRRHARPVYARLGILPAAAGGVNAATELPPAGR